MDDQWGTLGVPRGVTKLEVKADLIFPRAMESVGVSEPGLTPGVTAGEWENDLHLFEAVSAQMECDADVVAKWSETMVAAWVASVCNNKFEGYSDNFLRHHVDGPILLQMHASHLEVSAKVPAVC